jgi:hypothetical protein
MQEDKDINFQNPTLKECEEIYKFGWAVTYDGDNHKVLYGTECGCCGKYFWSEKIDYYCGGKDGCNNHIANFLSQKSEGEVKC